VRSPATAVPEPPITTVHLDTDEAEFVLEGELYRRPCTIVLETDPRPRLSFKIAEASPWMGWVSEKKISVRIVRADFTCDASIVSANKGILDIRPEREPISVGRSEDLREVQFDLMNFPSFWASDSPSTRLPDDHLDIAVDGWHIEIRPPRKSPDFDAFRSTLYSVTHSCLTRRPDNAAFGFGDAQNVLNVLHDAMSFAAGRWIAPVFVRGFGNDRQIAWREWGTRPLRPNFDSVETWFDAHHANALAEILPGLFELRKDDGQAATFHSALYWYLRSSGGAAGVDGGIILLQAALELLSWQVLVHDHGALSCNRFDSLPAVEQLRLLIKSCGVPVDIPLGLSDLQSKAMELNWSDGPQALTAVRNQLVHPNRHQQYPYYDAWRLAEWYLELVLLRILGFSGEYSDRTKAQRWVGAVDPVPWAKP
jgi:hypothetical protein